VKINHANWYYSELKMYTIIKIQIFIFIVLFIYFIGYTHKILIKIQMARSKHNIEDIKIIDLFLNVIYKYINYENITFYLSYINL